MVGISGRRWIGQMLCFHTWRILGGGDYFGVVLKHGPLAQPSRYFGSELGGAHSLRGRATAVSTGLHAELASVGKEKLSLCLLLFSSDGFSAAHLTSGTIRHVLFVSSEQMRFVKLNLTGRHWCQLFIKIQLRRWFVMSDEISILTVAYYIQFLIFIFHSKLQWRSLVPLT